MALRSEEYAPVGEVLSRVKGSMRLDIVMQPIPTAKSYGRVSAKNVRAPVNMPAFPTSHMDGYAVRAQDLKGATAVSPIALKVRQAASPARPLRIGEAAYVATGARLPTAADAVVPAEMLRKRGRTVVVTFSPRPWSQVYHRGEDIRRGSLVLRKGQSIRAQDVALLIAAGVEEVVVWRRPRVTVVATGSELTHSARPKSGKIRNSHSPFFLWLLAAVGCHAINMGIVRDEPEGVARAVRRALTRSDFALTLGGTSVGKHDVVGKAISSLRPDVFYHGVRMDRGRVAGVAVAGGKPILMMPGPIQGAMNAFVIFGIPIIHHLSGRTREDLRFGARMGADWEARRGFLGFKKVLYVRLRTRSETVAEPLRGETESMALMSEADGYVVVPEYVTRIRKGSRVKVVLLPGFSFAP